MESDNIIGEMFECCPYCTSRDIIELQEGVWYCHDCEREWVTGGQEEVMLMVVEVKEIKW